MGMTKDEEEILERIFNTKIEAMNAVVGSKLGSLENDITNLSTTMNNFARSIEKATDNNRDSIKQLFELDRRRTDEVTQMERELRTELTQAMVSVRETLSGHKIKFEEVDAKFKDLDNEKSDKNQKKQFTIGQIITVAVGLFFVVTWIVDKNLEFQEKQNAKVEIKQEQ